MALMELQTAGDAVWGIPKFGALGLEAMIGLAGARKSMGLAEKNGDFTIRIGI